MKEIKRRKLIELSASALAMAATGSLVSTTYAKPAKNIKADLDIFNFGGEAQQEHQKRLYKLFNKEYPNVKINDIYKPWGGGWGVYTNNFKMRVVGGLKTDILSIAIEGTQESIDTGLLRPLDEMINASSDLKNIVSQFEPALHNGLKATDGTTYFMTREWNNMIIHYNTKMFNEAGLEEPKADWTWDEFLYAAKKLTRSKGGKKIFGFGIPYFNFGMVPWWHTNNTSYLTDDWQNSNVNDPRMEESMNFLHSLLHEHKVSPAPEGVDPYKLMRNEGVAMTGAGRWPFPSYIKDNFRNVNIVNWPRHRAGTTVFGSGGYGITKECKHPELAMELIKYMVGEEHQMGYVKIGTSIPSWRSVSLTKEFSEFPKNAERFFGSLDDIKPVPSPKNFSEVESISVRHIGTMMTNQVSIKKGMKNWHDELQKAMDEAYG